MKSVIKNIYVSVLILVTLFLLYVLSLSAVFTIPNSFTQPRAADSFITFQKEGEYLQAFGDSGTAQLDNFTDRLMVEMTITNTEGSPFKSALSINNYPRYWHGYLIFLRPLMSFINYSNIRYLNIFFILLLLSFAFKELYKRFGAMISSAFIISIGMIYVTIFPMSLQFTSVFAVSMVAIIAMGYFKDYFKNFHLFYGYYFLIIGSLINFFDLLTAPLIALGLPLIYAYLMENNEESKPSFKENITFIIKNSVFWGIGYGATWFMKWAIASIVLKQNVINDAFNQILFRTNGGEEPPIVRLDVLKINFNLMFPPVFIKLFILFLIVWALLFVFNHKSIKEVFSLSPLLVVALFPYIWYFILSNHSRIHAWFTYRNQSITIFAILTYLLLCLDLKKIKDKLSFVNKKMKNFG